MVYIYLNKNNKIEVSGPPAPKTFMKIKEENEVIFNQQHIIKITLLLRRLPDLIANEGTTQAASVRPQAPPHCLS